MRVITAADQKRVVLIEGEVAAGIWALEDFESNAHRRTLLTDFQIVESYFTSVTGVEADSAAFVIRFIDDRRYELAVDVKIHLRIADAHLKLVGTGAGTNCAARR